MRIETIWYALVGLYLFWLTACAVVVTVVGIKTVAAVRANLMSLSKGPTTPKFNPANLPRRHRK